VHDVTAGFSSLPMYDFPEVRAATDAWWTGVGRHLRDAGITDVPEFLLRRDDLLEQWSDPHLLLSQTCGYILTHQLRGMAQVVATPHYGVPGCAGPTYSSVILARAGHPGRTPADFRHAVAVFSRTYSHAGYNALRGLIAPLADGKAFFSGVIGSGSHVDSIAALTRGAADIATVDCILHAFVARFRPAALDGTRFLGFTPAAPAAPYIVPRGGAPDRLRRVRAALGAAATDPSLADARRDLCLDGFSFDDAPDYAAIVAVENAALRLGYPELA
jgi:ABC-type phosphate/phosphonate transport system substrate-binding protein